MGGVDTAVRVLLATAIAATSAVSLRAQAVDFTADVLPVLRDGCFRCHRGEYTDDNGRVRRPKGGLRLDGKAWILKGGKTGSVLTPGQALRSPMYTRTVLPADHDDRMPASGEPLSEAQTEVLRSWIDGGAGFGAWVGEAGPDAPKTPPVPDGDAKAPPPPSASFLDLARVAAGLTPLAAPTLAKAAAGKAHVTPLWHGSALLRVEYAGAEDEVGDAEVAALSPLRDHIAVLVLARTKITDAACAEIARMPRLVRLDLRETRVADAGIARLGALPELRVLNLFATDVGDTSVAALKSLPKLAELRVWQSRMTPAAIAALEQAKPGLDVLAAPALPGAETQKPPGRGRRRGK